MSKKNLDRLVESVIFENYLNEDMGSRAVAPGTLHADPVLGNTGYGKLVVKKNPETTVVSITIGKNTVQDVLRSSLAFGADRSILVETELELGPLQIAKILRKIGLFDFK